MSVCLPDTHVDTDDSDSRCALSDMQLVVLLRPRNPFELTLTCTCSWEEQDEIVRARLSRMAQARQTRTEAQRQTSDLHSYRSLLYRAELPALTC